MKRLSTLALAVILITGCNAMKPKMEETERLSQWAMERYTAQATAIQQRGTWREILADTQPDKSEIARATIPAPTPVAEQAKARPQEAETPEMTTGAALESQAAPMPEPGSPCQPEQTEPQQREQPEEPPVMINWPYPQITCPPEPSSTPEPTETPQEEATPVPVDPAPEATEQPAGGYAKCSCGARLSPDELVPHMKAHAMNGESHSYTAY